MTAPELPSSETPSSVTKTMEGPDMSNLQSKKGRDILDIVDALRSQGMGYHVELPQIIVCGDQSSGKSSVLEALSGMAFPAKDALCTRFATELILRRSADGRGDSLKVSIIPGPERTDAERKILEDFAPDTKGSDLASIIEQATDVMGLAGTDRVFCTDILCVEASSPTLPHLTLVDLPGLFLAGNKDQSMADAKIVESLVLSYMEQTRSIILAVVSAKSEFGLQQVTERTREVDPEGHRTLGLITKPDTLNEGSESERFYLELAQNKDVHFRLGWHVLRNRDFKTRNYTNSERDALEKSFFSKGVWKSLDPNQTGIDSLRHRLSRVLQDQVLAHLPQVLEDINTGIAECKSALSKLGMSRETMGDQRRYLLQVSQSFTGLVKAAISAEYSDRQFFGDSTTSKTYQRRLRSQVQDTLIRFAETMRLQGHAKAIVETKAEASKDSQPPKTTRTSYAKKVNELIRLNRGCELPGTFNPLLVGEMFSEQCQPWGNLARDSVRSILTFARTTLLAATKHVADEETAKRLNVQVITPRVIDLETSTLEKLDELLEKYTKGHPITYNHYLTENVQKAQKARHERKLREEMSLFCDVNCSTATNMYFNPEKLFSSVLDTTQPDMETYASMMAIDLMEAYYKVRRSLGHNF